jgi:hypothetical protein
MVIRSISIDFDDASVRFPLPDAIVRKVRRHSTIWLIWVRRNFRQSDKVDGKRSSTSWNSPPHGDKKLEIAICDFIARIPHVSTSRWMDGGGDGHKNTGHKIENKQNPQNITTTKARHSANLRLGRPFRAATTAKNMWPMV